MKKLHVIVSCSSISKLSVFDFGDQYLSEDGKTRGAKFLTVVKRFIVIFLPSSLEFIKFGSGDTQIL